MQRQFQARSRYTEVPRAPKVCKIMAFMAIIMGLGLLFCIPKP